MGDRIFGLRFAEELSLWIEQLEVYPIKHNSINRAEMKSLQFNFSLILLVSLIFAQNARSEATYDDRADQQLIKYQNFVNDPRAPADWYPSFLKFLEPFRSLIGGLGVRHIEVQSLEIQWNGWLLGSPYRLIIGKQQCAFDNTPLKDSFVLSAHEVAHVVLTDFLHQRLSEEYIESNKLPFNSAQIKIEDMEFAYQELFADAFVVMGLQEPNAIEEAITRCLGDKSGLSRSFLDIPSSDQWPTKESHGLFSPARVFIYKELYLKRFRADLKNRVTVLKILADAIASTLKNNFDSQMTISEWKLMAPQDLNRNLIKLLGEADNQ